jgi:DNA-binding LacI/PurR family transcriptional regulator
MKKVTLKSISERCGVSVATVSAVLNESPSCYASKRIKDNIFQTAKDLGYKANIFARALRTNKSNTIGVIAPSLEKTVTTQKIELLEEIAWKNGYSMLIGYSRNKVEREKRIISDFLSRCVDGIILISGFYSKENYSYLKKLAREKFPLLVMAGVDEELPFISTDYVKGGELAADHLLKLGHRNISIIGNSDSAYMPHAQRIKGFIKRLEKENVELNLFSAYDKDHGSDLIADSLLQTNLIELGRKIAAENLFGKKVKRSMAVYAINDALALGVAKAAWEKGFKIPEDISIVGFDDGPIASSYSFIPITSIRQDNESLCNSAFESLMGIISQKTSSCFSKYIEPELIVRASSGPAR